jgi:glycosyltransferase involved in cell wall biosynthesis
MNIAIVGPSPKPFTIGGMEYLLWGLYEHINKDTPHKAELIKLPTQENSFWNLINSYKQFYKLDLSHFDMVITTKYPAWMVEHDNHVCYMAHRLRGVYDTYHFTNLPIEVNIKNSYIKEIIDYIESKDNSIDGLFELLDKLYENKYKIPNEYFIFPGPFIRKIVHFLDGKALSKNKIKRFCSISETVKNRKEYFPPNVNIDVIYPPSFLQKFKTGNYEYLFTISRLDNPKRISLMIEAMKYVNYDIKLKIAGTGPMEEELKSMASNDSRIEFLGFINDDQAIDYYSNALCVLYLPYQEDYGLVTIESMMSKKPVITCEDSGGPNEFVINAVNGFSVKADPKEIAEKINYFVSNRNKAIEMGKKAFESVSNITWENTVNLLIDENYDIKKDKKIMTVVTTFPVYPPTGGGQARVYNLYKNLTHKYKINLVSSTNNGENGFDKFIAEDMREVRIPKTSKHQEKEYELETKLKTPVSDSAMLLYADLTPSYINNIIKSINESQVVSLCHPFLYNHIKKYLDDKILIYEAQDVEYQIKKEMYPDSKIARQLLKKIYETERELCFNADIIMTCSQEDKEKLLELYNIKKNKIIVVPNGVDVNKTKFISIDTRKKLKKELGLENEKLVLFMGSWHKPNLEACEYIFEFARKTPDIKYLLMGSQCLAFENRKLPENIGLLGIVNEETKQRVFSLVDVAINPMTSGSGTNLKMFDYMAAGIPIITTEFGTRGMDNKDCFIISDIENMAFTIKKTLSIYNVDQLVNRARKYVEETFDWSKIVSTIVDSITTI